MQINPGNRIIHKKVLYTSDIPVEKKAILANFADENAMFLTG